MRTSKSNRTRVLYRRVSDCPELVEMVDKAILKAAQGSFNIKGFFLDTYGVEIKDVGAIVKTVNVPPSKEAHDAIQYLTEISTLKAQNMACLDNVVELEEKVKKLEDVARTPVIPPSVPVMDARGPKEKYPGELDFLRKKVKGYEQEYG